ncbi:metal-dependent hydrolase [Thermoplasmatales archaeon]|nr:metal-dependent hydrolase [Thermoplasmatales archaeon]
MERDITIFPSRDLRKIIYLERSFQIMTDKVLVKWHGHACFTLDFGKKVVVDPFITGNPSAKIKKEDIKADLVVVTHGHSDHVGDSVYIAKKNGVPLVTMVELAWILEEENKDLNAIGINYSGNTKVDGIKVSAVLATHSSGYNGKYAGGPTGMIIENGVSVYHAGDTGVFKDMELIGEMYHPDVALLPIGGHYTMSPHEAAIAAGMIKAPAVVPMHYNTFDLIKQDPAEFKKEAEENHKVKVSIMKVEEELSFDKARH